MYTSNKNNPDYQEYFQTLADIIGVFWQFYKERIAAGDTQFSFLSSRERIAFDAQRLIDNAREYRSFQGKNIIREYAYGTYLSLESSWGTFLEFLANSTDHEITAGGEGSARFIDPYVNTLCQRAEELGETVGQYREDVRMKQVVTAAMGTGTKVTTHLVALFGEEFKPVLPVIISKVRNDQIAERELGLIQTSDIGEFDGIGANYNLLDKETGAFNKERLRTLGLGDTLGCPASMPVSKLTKGFLYNKGVVVKRTMLEEYSHMVGVEFNRTVGEWFGKLSNTEKQMYLTGEALTVLDGSLWENVRSRRDKPACPYAKERM